MEIKRFVSKGVVTEKCSRTCTPEWISVNDRLPDPIKGSYWSETVIVYSDGEVTDSYALFNDDLTFIRFAKGCNNTTHWMTLPAPPKCCSITPE